MGNFNIKIDRPKPTEDEIQKFENFDGILKAVKQTSLPFYKKSWFWGSTGLASVGVATVFTLNAIQTNSLNQNTNIANEEGLPPDTECIKAPIKNVDIPFSTFVVEANKEEQINLESGTKITIPKDALICEDDNQKVEIKIREFRDKSSSFIAGIPMDLDKNQAFESAGMIEIRGTQNNEPVAIDQNKPIKVDFVCAQNPENFDFWYLHEKEKQWKKYPISKEKTTDNSNVKSTKNTNNVSVLKEDLQETKKEIVILETKISSLKEPSKVTYKIPEVYHQKFDLDFDKKEYPELASFENLVFEVVPLEGYDKSFSKKNWNNVELLKENAKYVMHFTNPNENFKVQVRPILQGKELKVAENQFDDAMKSYVITKKDLEVKKSEALKKQQETERNLAHLLNIEETPNGYLTEKKENTVATKQNRSFEKSQEILNASSTLSFQTTRWGVFNSDRPILYPEPLASEIPFLFEGNKQANFKQIIVFNLTKNCRYEYGLYRQPLSNFGIHAKDDLVIIGIDEEGKIGHKELKNRTGMEILTKLEFSLKEKSENTAIYLKKLVDETPLVS